MDETQTLRLAREAIQQGNKKEGIKLLSQAIRSDPHNATAWLWLSAIIGDADRERQCLERVLAIDPHNETARKHLARLSKTDVSKTKTRPEHPITQEAAKPARANKAPSARVSRGPISISPVVILAVLGIAVVIVITIVGVVALSRLSASSASPTAESTSRPTAMARRSTPTATPRVSAVCQSSTERYLGQIGPKLLEFTDAVRVADSTPRIALSGVIQDMQRIRRDIQSVPAPGCASSAASLVVRGVDSIIDGFTDFMASRPDSTVQRKVSQGFLDMDNGLSQLQALSFGIPTPMAAKLPTSRPTPTPIPTPTPLPVGSPIVIDTWQIRVERVETTEQMTSSVSTYKAAGRFALLFLEITNRGLSPRTFVAVGTLEIQDAQGRSYEEHSAASFAAMSQYNTRTGADMSPDETRHLVAAFDISERSGFYVLVPGLLADPYGPSVRLNIP